MATKYVGEKTSPYPDIPVTVAWFNAILDVVNRGLMQPELSGEFRSDDFVDGAEALLAIRVLKQRLNIY